MRKKKTNKKILHSRNEKQNIKLTKEFWTYDKYQQIYLYQSLISSPFDIQLEKSVKYKIQNYCI